MDVYRPDRLAEALRGPVAEAIAVVGRMIDGAEEQGDRSTAAQLAVEAALLCVKAGDTGRAESYMGTAMAAAEASGSETVRLVVAWRYTAMMSMLDRTADAVRYAKALSASLEPGHPLHVRVIGLSVSGTVAAASGRWREVLRVSEALSELLAEGAGSDARPLQGLVAQAELGIAEASMRLGDEGRATVHASRAFELARRHGMSAVGSSALGILFLTKSTPPGVDFGSWLEAAVAGYKERGDVLGQIGSGLVLAWLYREQGATERALALFADLEEAAVAAEQGFAWAKVMIWRAQLRTDVDRALHELTRGWAVLCEVAGAMADPGARQSLLIDWRTLAADTLEWLHGRCPRPLPAAAGRLAVTVMTALAGDGVAAALHGGGEDEDPAQEGAGPALDDLADALAARWRADALAPPDTLESLAGRDVLAYRVLEARADLLRGWRVHIDPYGAVEVAPFAVEGAAAQEIKRLADGDPRAPSPDPEVWRQAGAALLPAGLAAGAAEELLLVPHGPLWLVPFGALDLCGSALVEQRTLSHLPSLSQPRGTAVGRPLTAAVLADPLLPGIELELGALAEVTARPPVTAATAAGLERALEDAPEILFLGAHGEGSGPAFRLELEEEELALERLLAWRLPGWVIASSCLSGRHNAEVWPPSLVTVCRLRGAAHVLGATWEVPSRPTGRIVADTIRNVGGGDGPALALRRAQRAARARGWPVRNWAGLVTFG
ncbi:CHAT domain-containing protein [Streptomyces sp. NPDC020983]|uniref:CHAT domain-containing protein n=1 Tax=Streptomyces sp. NPDC020983 TaxID=3365106 RepID=UPI00379042E2